MNKRNIPNTRNESNERVRTLDLPGGMGRVGIKELMVDTVTPTGRSPKTPRLVAIHHHLEGWEWEAPDDAGYVLLVIGSNAIVAQVMKKVIKNVYVVTASGVMVPSHPGRRLKYRSQVNELLTLPEHGSFQLTVDPDLTAKDQEEEAAELVKHLAEITDPNYGKEPVVAKPDTPAPAKRVEPQMIEQPAHEGKLTGRRSQPAPDVEAEGKKPRRNRRRASEEPTDPRQAAVAYAAVRAVSGIPGETPAQRATRLADERAERQLRIAQGG